MRGDMMETNRTPIRNMSDPRRNRKRFPAWVLIPAVAAAAVFLCVLLHLLGTSEPEKLAAEASPGESGMAVPEIFEKTDEEHTLQESSAAGIVNEQPGTEKSRPDAEKDTHGSDTEPQDLPAAEILDFVDVFGVHYQTEILPEVTKTPYARERFIHNGYRLTYEDDIYTSRMGVDVSHHQGKVDWNKVKAAGFDFAFIRLGYRGYGQAGSINLDKTYAENVRGAHEAGLEVGVYFFAQAINEEEAKEEAEFVIRNLEGSGIELPVVYDPESILDADARTDNVSGEQFTKNTLVFCSAIEEAGYRPMVYSNMLWEAFQFDMTQVSKYPLWYADYEAQPQTPYDFVFWQYSNEGRVDGISGSADLNIELIRK